MNKRQLTNTAINILDRISSLPKNELIFKKIFGEPKAFHLWFKFRDSCESDWLNLWQLLDLENRRILANYLTDFWNSDLS